MVLAVGDKTPFCCWLLFDCEWSRRVCRETRSLTVVVKDQRRSHPRFYALGATFSGVHT